MSQSSNELYVLHLRGRMMHDRAYEKLSTARGAMRHLHVHEQNECSIVRYVPDTVIEHSADTIEAYKERKEKQRKKKEKLRREYKKREIEFLKKELERAQADVQNETGTET